MFLSVVNLSPSIISIPFTADSVDPGLVELQISSVHSVLAAKQPCDFENAVIMNDQMTRKWDMMLKRATAIRKIELQLAK